MMLKEKGQQATYLNNPVPYSGIRIDPARIGKTWNVYLVGKKFY